MCYYNLLHAPANIDDSVTQVKWWITKKLDDSVTTKEIRRLVLNILNFTFTIEIIKTDENLVADYLSRKRNTN